MLQNDNPSALHLPAELKTRAPQVHNHKSNGEDSTLAETSVPPLTAAVASILHQARRANRHKKLPTSALDSKWVWIHTLGEVQGRQTPSTPEAPSI